MLTIFTIPKAFEDHNGVIQYNAIESWRRLNPRCEIILCADDPGTAEVAKEFNIKHLPDVARNSYGTPTLDSAFNQVREIASNNYMCYVNADIILLSDFMRAFKRVKFQQFLMIGRRWNVEITEPWDFEAEGWEHELREFVKERGKLFSPSGIDYFVFPRDSDMGKLPPFAVGRPGWDNYFIYQTRRLGVQVVDATRAVMAIHQDHNYDHVADGVGKKARGPEGDENVRLAGGANHMFNVHDATHIVTPTRVMPALGLAYTIRRLEAFPVLGSGIRWLRRMVKSLIRRPLRFVARLTG